MKHLFALCALCAALALALALAVGPAEAGRSRGRTAQPDTRAADQNTHVHALTIGGLERTYQVYVPPGAAPGAKRPLILVLHGTYGTGEKMQKDLGFDPYARKRGFLAAYPDAYQEAGGQRTTRWNDGRGVLRSSALGVDDVAFLAAVVDDIGRRYGVDKARVFATGASNGGIMTYRLGCEARGLFRAIAPEIGNVAEPLAALCTPEPGLSILSINGDLDPFIPLNGGEVCAGVSARMCEGGRVLSREQSMATFARAARCAAPTVSIRRPAAVEDGTWVEEITYTGCAPGQEVRSLIVHGMGHTWPPRQSQVAKGGPSTGNLDATQEVVDFFLSQP